METLYDNEQYDHSRLVIERGDDGQLYATVGWPPARRPIEPVYGAGGMEIPVYNAGREWSYSPIGDAGPVGVILAPDGSYIAIDEFGCPAIYRPGSPNDGIPAYDAYHYALVGRDGLSLKR